MRNRKLKFEAIRVPCPRCGAYESKPCVGKGARERKAFHAERHAKASKEKRLPRKKMTYPKDWAATRAKVFALKGSQCVYCGADASHVDHQTPKAMGGTDEITNLVPACSTCNVAKGMMTLEEWRG
jgi:5-methylcytosine-specific restriction endonuclease McrA